MPSIYTQILADVYGLTAAAAPVFSLTIRKKLIRLEHDRLPLCLIVPNYQAQGIQGFEGFMQRSRQVGVAMIFAGNMTLETGLDQMIDAIDAVQKALNVTRLPTASWAGDPNGVFDSKIDLDPPFDTRLLDEANLDYSLLQVAYKCNETRN